MNLHATQADAQAAFDIRLLAIRSQCIGAYSREQMLLWTRGRAEDGYSALMDKPFYLGWVNGEPVVTGMLDPDNHEVGALFVLPEFAGRGYGKAMLDHLENLAWSSVYTPVSAPTASDTPLVCRPHNRTPCRSSPR